MHMPKHARPNTFNWRVVSGAAIGWAALFLASIAQEPEVNWDMPLVWAMVAVCAVIAIAAPIICAALQTCDRNAQSAAVARISKKLRSTSYGA